MKWLFWFSLLLINQPATESMEKVESCFPQLNMVIWRKPGQSAVLTCTDNTDCLGENWRYEWFCFKENTHLHLKLLQADNHLKFRLEGVFLNISSLHTNDSGVYYCAAIKNGHPAPSSQHVGLGTTLIVKGNDKIMVRTVLLLLFILLSIYSMAIVTLMVKKYGCRRSHKTDKNNSSKKKQFHDVLQEMCRKGNLERTKQTDTSKDLNSTSDDIYQNV